jgi:hypothetical protein
MIIISSPIGFPKSTVKFEEIPFPENLTGCISFCGHPATKALLEALGAKTVAGKWTGPEIGESYLSVPLVVNGREDGYTKDVAIKSITELKAILCVRVG